MWPLTIIAVGRSTQRSQSGRKRYSREDLDVPAHSMRPARTSNLMLDMRGGRMPADPDVLQDNQKSPNDRIFRRQARQAGLGSLDLLKQYSMRQDRNSDRSHPPGWLPPESKMGQILDLVASVRSSFCDRPALPSRREMVMTAKSKVKEAAPKLCRYLFFLDKSGKKGVVRFRKAVPHHVPPLPI